MTSLFPYQKQINMYSLLYADGINDEHMANFYTMIKSIVIIVFWMLAIVCSKSIMVILPSSAYISHTYFTEN